MSAELETKSFPLDYVQELRAENAHYRVKAKELDAASTVTRKGYLPHGVTPYTTDLSVHINHFPLGDTDNFSVSRAAYAKAQSGGRMEGRAWDMFAPWEKAYLHALAKVSYKAQGDQVSGQDGGFLAPEDWNATWFGLLRSFTVLDQLPITRVSVPARIEHLPKVSGDVTVSYPGENTSPTGTTFQFGQVSYTAHKAMAFMNVSNELIRDASELADQMFRKQTAAAIATDRDTQLLVGPTTGPGPTGLVSLASIGTISKYYPGANATTVIGTSGAHGIPSFLHVSGLRDKVHQLNGSTKVTAGQAHCTGIIAHSRLENEIFTLTAAAGPWTDGQGRPLWMTALGATQDTSKDGERGDPNGLMGQAWALTNILPVNSADGGGSASSFMIAGWWEQYVLFECLSPAYDATIFGGSASVGFGADETQIKVIYRYDGAPAHPEAFAVLAGCD